jgi:hypothetical protein
VDPHSTSAAVKARRRNLVFLQINLVNAAQQRAEGAWPKKPYARRVSKSFAGPRGNAEESEGPSPWNF